ncbi:MAG: FAD-dependent thymidylate synthase [Oscillospiraceae bacterium]|nr:FAD-dependent thymidylate synthase [Oscillospiraceae bacterium]
MPQGTAKIISVNQENTRICAGAARISTTQGDAMCIFSDTENNAGNSKLIEKVLRSGHTSFLEHAVFTIAFSNVSVLVEQFFIEFRLASYTVKSRRYVDFGKMGYYTPEKMSDEAERLYRSHVEFLFGEYNYFVNNGIPKEDARFLLPYSFHSNFYCTVNARELQHMLKEIFEGRGAMHGELTDLGNQLREQLEELFPFILKDIGRCEHRPVEKPCFPKISPESAVTNSNVELISYTDSTRGVQNFPNTNPRLLEFISAAYIIRNISLSGLTHLVRHRLQSIIIPPIWHADPNRYLIPPSVAENGSLENRYRAAFAKNAEAIHKLREHGFSDEAYLALSGNTLDVITSMNAREMDLFFKLRCCTRAQWEIRKIAVDMLDKLRAEDEKLFAKFGASCFADGKCPEGRLSCGKIQTG